MNDVINKLQAGFDEHFGQYRGVPIGIYGTGKNAETILNSITGYDFKCLIATDHLHEMIYGLKVVPLCEAVEKVRLIIIAAIPSSTAIVYDRIKEDVPDSMPIYSMHGRLLTGDEGYRDNAYWKCSIDDLYNAIDSHEVISFDIFDTLITRRALQPQDVPRLVESMLVNDQNKGTDIERFADVRMAADRAMYSRFTSPTIECIYEYLANELSISAQEAERIKDIELSVEMSVVVPRKIMAEALDHAVKKGKQVILTSDMFFGSDDIRKILCAARIDVKCEMLISCEYDASKEKGSLFEILKEKAQSSSILHIGDSPENDIEKARENGIDTFYIKKGYDILAESSGAYIFDRIRNDADRQILGYIISEMFNDPFILNTSKGKLKVDSYRDIALRIFPITAVYMAYIEEHASSFDMLFFASRDGYFLHRTYERLRSRLSHQNLPPSKYVYMSRSAVSGASIFTTEDIEVLSNKIEDDPKLNLRDFYRMQFHITLPEEFDMTNADAIDKWGIEGLKEKLSEYNELIINNSAIERKRYLGYLDLAGVLGADHPAIIDIVTQGTLVYGLGRIIGKDMGLIAMGTSCVPNKYISDKSLVHALYGNITERIGGNIHSMTDFSETHLLLEMLYGSTDGQLQGFDDEYNPIFVSGTEYDEKLLQGVQKELEKLLDYIVDIGLFGKISREFAMDVLRMCIGKYSEYSDDIREAFAFNDPYDGSLKESNLIDYIQ